MNKFILKNKLLATTAICAFSMCANTVKAEYIPTNGDDSAYIVTKVTENDYYDFRWYTGLDENNTPTFEYYTYAVKDVIPNQALDSLYIHENTDIISNNFIGIRTNDAVIYNNNYSINKICSDFIANYYKDDSLFSRSGIYNKNGNIENISGDFISNYLISIQDSPYSNFVGGGAIDNAVLGTIKNISGNFINNYVYEESNTARGGAIANSSDYDPQYIGGTIETINGQFIGNYAKSYGFYGEPYCNPMGDAKGGAIYNSGKIVNISGKFIDNYTNATNDANGGAIYNESNSTIESITGDFMGNYATSTTSEAYGGAIGNGAIIDIIIGSFIDNSAISTSGGAEGGAIWNYGTISSITGDFIGNSATSTNGSASGGAIYKGNEIGIITGNFLDNYARTESGNAQGGAIYGNATIYGQFKNNYAETSTGSAYGGAIYAATSGPTDSVDLGSPSFFNNYAKSKTGNAQGGALYLSGRPFSIKSDGSTPVIFKGNYVEDKDGKRYEAIYLSDKYAWGSSSGKGSLDFVSNNDASYILYDYINSDNTGIINFTGDGTGTFNLYNNIQNQKDVNFQNKYVINMISADDIHAGTSKYSYIQAQNININAALQMMLDVDLEAKEMDRFEAENFTIADGGSIDVTKFNIVTDLTGDIGTTTEVEFILSDNVTGLDKITNITEAVGEVYTYSVTFNTETGAFEFVSTGIAPGYTPPLAPEEVAPNQAPVLTTNTTVATVETVVAQIFDRDVTISADTNYGADTTDYIETSDGVNVTNDKSVWVKTFGSDDDVEVDNFNGTIDSEAYGVVGGVDSKVFTYDNGVKAAYGVYGAYVGGKQKYNDSKIEQKSGYLGVSASFRKNNLFSNFTLNGGYVTSESNTELGKDEFDTKVVSVANKTGFDIKAGNNWTITPAMYVAYTGMDNEDYTNKAGVKMENEFANVITLAPEVKVRKGFNNGVGAYAKASYKHYIYDSEVKADDVVLEEMSAKPYVEYGFGVEKNWADKSGYVELTRRDGGREGWNVNLGLRLNF